MSIYYSEMTFYIDLVRELHHTNDVAIIRRKLLSDLNVKATKAEIEKCLNYTEEPNKDPRTVTMKQIFN